MAKKKTKPAYEPGDLEKMAPPNDRIQHGPGNLSRLRKATGESAFIIEHGARGDDGEVFKLTRIDPILLEELLDADPRVRRLGIRADEKGRWTPAMLDRMELEVERVFEEEYLPLVLEEFAEIRRQIAEYALLRQAGNLELLRLHQAIDKHRPKR